MNLAHPILMADDFSSGPTGRVFVVATDKEKISVRCPQINSRNIGIGHQLFIEIVFQRLPVLLHQNLRTQQTFGQLGCPLGFPQIILTLFHGIGSDIVHDDTGMIFENFF